MVMRDAYARSRRRILGAAVAAALLTTAVMPGLAIASDGGGFRHVFVVMMENTGFDALIGNPNAPFINATAATAGLATSYFGVTHPSQPNYIANTSGSTNGVADDNDTTIDVRNIVDQLESHGRSWTDYQQSLSLCVTKLDHACGNQLYERKHNPFVSYADVQSSPARLAHVVDLTQLDADLASGHVANYNFIAPDQCHDMHGRGGGGAADPCDFSNVQGLIATGDAFLRDLVHEITSSRAWTPKSVIFITWDESDFTNSGPFGFGDTSGCCDANPGGGHVVTLVISQGSHQARTSARPFNHFSMLATIERSWHLGCLGFTCDRKNVKVMNALIGH